MAGPTCKPTKMGAWKWSQLLCSASLNKLLEGFINYQEPANEAQYSGMETDIHFSCSLQVELQLTLGFGHQSKSPFLSTRHNLRFITAIWSAGQFFLTITPGHVCATRNLQSCDIDHAWLCFDTEFDCREAFRNTTYWSESMQVLCAAWTVDGQHLALGMYNGHISICDKSGVEQVFDEILTMRKWTRK